MAVRARFSLKGRIRIAAYWQTIAAATCAAFALTMIGTGCSVAVKPIPVEAPEPAPEEWTAFVEAAKALMAKAPDELKAYFAAEMAWDEAIWAGEKQEVKDAAKAVWDAAFDALDAAAPDEFDDFLQAEEALTYRAIRTAIEAAMAGAYADRRPKPQPIGLNR